MDAGGPFQGSVVPEKIDRSFKGVLGRERNGLYMVIAVNIRIPSRPKIGRW